MFLFQLKKFHSDLEIYNLRKIKWKSSPPPPPVLDKGARYFRVAANKFTNLTIKIMLIILFYIKKFKFMLDNNILAK